MICGNCGTENRPDRKFCLRCGTALSARCANCGATNEPEAAFCGECGTSLGPPVEADQAGSGSAPGPAAEPSSERRLVTVLFADLVAFTTLPRTSTPRTRATSSARYFDASRETIERYGGTVEKFIGDAVMAVWGAPTAHEDDAERAVRAALDLVAAVPELTSGRLEARAGVLTGEAAVTVGANGQGMVAGDLVNTASGCSPSHRRARPGRGGDIPRRRRRHRVRAGGRAVAQGQGRAGRCMAGDQRDRQGARRRQEEFVEPPFVGRDAEFAVIKERLHATSRDGRARLVSLTGVAGIGKSRLVWELEKYARRDPRARVLAPGALAGVWRGLTSGPLARWSGVAPGSRSATTRRRPTSARRHGRGVLRGGRRAALDPITPARPLGLDDLADVRRDELFAAWRRLFEQIASRATVVLVFEDLQWADDGQIEFIDSLMEWSRQHPILIVTLARPEVFERRPTWGAGPRDFTALHLEPLPTAAMTALVEGLGGDLPPSVVETIVNRAEGIPLYAVELFRMQLDRGRLARDERGYRVVGSGELDVPESLQSLIAARLDALPPAERRLVQDAAVLGQTFTPDSVASVAGQPPDDVGPLLRGLVRRELLELDHDPRSPERGQYRFVGGLVREVAYATLARRDRRSRHLAAARHFEALGDDELAGVLASHYLSAHAASQPGPEAEAVAAQARLALRGAADRALAVASPEAACAYLRQALAVTVEPAETARLHEDIARISLRAAHWQIAEDEAGAALAAYEALGDPRGVARASSVRGNILFFQGRIEASVEMLERALRGLEGSDPQLAVELHRQLGRAELFRSQPDRAMQWVEAGLAEAARLDDLGAIADLLITRAWGASMRGRTREGIAENRGALAFAREHGLVGAELRAVNNLATFLLDENPAEAIRLADQAMEVAERVGDRDSVQKLAFIALAKMFAGDWDGARALVERWLHDDAPNLDYLPLAFTRATMLAWSGNAAEADAQARVMRERLQTSESLQDRFGMDMTEFWLAQAGGRDEEALAAAVRLADVDRGLGGSGWQGSYFQGLSAARRGDSASLRAATDAIAASTPQLQPLAAARRVLEGALHAHEGRSREAAMAYRDGLERFERIGLRLEAALGGLDAVEVLGPGDPVAAEAADAIRAYVTQTGAVVLERHLEAALARATAAAARLPATAAPDQRSAAPLPQNVRTTS